MPAMGYPFAGRAECKARLLGLTAFLIVSRETPVAQGGVVTPV
jgi:hypothetical protein